MFYDLARDLARELRLQEASEFMAIRDAEMSGRLARKQLLDNPSRYYFTEKERVKAEKEAHLKRRTDEADGLNERVSEALFRFEQILRAAVTTRTIGFDKLRSIGPPPALSFDTALLQAAPRPLESDYLESVEELAGLMSWLPARRKKYEDDVKDAEEQYGEALHYWEQSEAARLDSLRLIKSDYEKQLRAYEQAKADRSSEIDAFASSYEAGQYEAIVAFHAMVFERSNYPEDFPCEFSLAYTASSKMLVIEYRLPNPSVVPPIEEYRYVRAGDKITEKVRKQSSLAELYADIVASIALRSLQETFSLDSAGHIDVVCFNGYIHTIDPATGKDIQPHLLSVRTSKAEFSEIDLKRVDKQICLRNLGAHVSKNLDEATPVRPIVEFKMADARFVDQADLVSTLSSAPNLMDLSPTEFEHLVANLFGKMGLESKLTRSSRDGGVDCIAYDPRPVLGGKVVIQAKRYRHTVGVSAVRDLYGTMMNEGASKGLLVTTSGYGPDAYQFAKDKPIELIEGGGLLFLLQEIGVQARIMMPDD